MQPGNQTIQKRSLDVASVSQSRTTLRQAFTVQWHLQMRITEQVFQNTVSVKVFSDTSNHLVSGQAIPAKALKSTNTQICPDPMGRGQRSPMKACIA